MKLVFLNTWGGEVREGISEFITAHATDTDVFCFQEAYSAPMALFRQLLPEYQDVFVTKPLPDGDVFSQATFVKKGITIAEQQALFPEATDIGLIVYTELQYPGGVLHLCNVHGVSQPGKDDNPSRIAQSQAIVDLMSAKKGPKIIGGDFNVLPETESVGMFTRYGYRDLIREYAITTTRNRYAWERYPGNELYYSDYVFISPDVSLASFAVLPLEVSDHLPMIVEID